MTDNRLAGADFLRAAACLVVIGHHLSQRMSWDHSLGWMEWMDDRLTPGDENADRARRFPMSRRLGTGEDLGGLAVLLSAEESAPYVTGQVFAVDGGLTQHQ